jgi:hypothetical protein
VTATEYLKVAKVGDRIRLVRTYEGTVVYADAGYMIAREPQRDSTIREFTMNTKLEGDPQIEVEVLE